MGCFVVAEFLLTSASCGPSAIAEPLVKTVAIFGRNISQGSVSTLLRCGAIFKNYFIANLPINLPVQEF